MPFKYAAFTVMTPEYTIEETAELLASLGYNGVEWRVHSVPECAPAKPDFWRCNKATVDIDTIVEKAPEIRRISEDNGLEIVGLGTYLGCKLLSDVERCMEAARLMDCGSIRLAAPRYDGSQDYNDLYEEALAGFEAVETLAQSYKVRANIEIRQGSICSSASLAYRVASEFDPDAIGVIVDPGNMVCEGYENWQLGLELLGPYLSYVHVKNAVWTEETTPNGAKRWKHTVVGLRDGLVPWHEVVIALDRAGYTGWLSVEDFAPGDTKAKLAEDIAYLRSLDVT